MYFFPTRIHPLTESENWLSGTALKIEPFAIELKEREEVSIEGKISLNNLISSGFALKTIVNDYVDICDYQVFKSMYL